VPGAPALNSATPGNTQVSLSWTAPASNGGSAITGYTATASPGGATCTTGGATTCTITGLTNGTSYSISVTATNAAGTGPGSNVLTATPRTVPGAPQNLTAAPHKSKGVNLAWSAPSTNGGSAITGYKIYRRTSSGSFVQVATVNASTITYHDTTTTKGAQYFYVVRATNTAGDSAASNEAGAIAK
jgi:fibronectin type 3 domain-containing protein